MKTNPIASILGLAVTLALVGCATVQTLEASRIVRFVPVAASVIKPVAAEQAKIHGYTLQTDGRWQSTIISKKDPIIGLVSVQGDPTLAIRFAMTFEEVNTKATRLVIDPVIAIKKPFSSTYQERPLGTGDSERQKILAVVDATEAEAETIAAQKTKGPQ